MIKKRDISDLSLVKNGLNGSTPLPFFNSKHIVHETEEFLTPLVQDKEIAAHEPGPRPRQRPSAGIKS